MTDATDQTTGTVQPLLINLPTKENISKAQAHLGMLDLELTCLARQIKIWMCIASPDTKNRISIQHDPFFAWIQFNSLSQFSINSIKITQDTKKWVKSALALLMLDGIHSDNLIENSKLQNRITMLSKVAMPLKVWRNKRHAHFEPVEIDNVTCNLEALYIALAELRNSLDYIWHFVANPHYIFSAEWNIFTIHDTETNKRPSELDRYFEKDPTILSLQKVLNVCGERTSTILTALELFQKIIKE